jgi:hypothetical protein
MVRCFYRVRLVVKPANIAGPSSEPVYFDVPCIG